MDLDTYRGFGEGFSQTHVPSGILGGGGRLAHRRRCGWQAAARVSLHELVGAIKLQRDVVEAFVDLGTPTLNLSLIRLERDESRLGLLLSIGETLLEFLLAGRRPNADEDGGMRPGLAPSTARVSVSITDALREK
jgi:hypothetical protein